MNYTPIIEVLHELRGGEPQLEPINPYRRLLEHLMANPPDMTVVQASAAFAGLPVKFRLTVLLSIILRDPRLCQICTNPILATLLGQQRHTFMCNYGTWVVRAGLAKRVKVPGSNRLIWEPCDRA